MPATHIKAADPAAVPLTVYEGAAVVTIDRPANRNALGPAEASLLAERLSTAGACGAPVVVLAGAPPAFCAGGDLGVLVEVTRGASANEVQTVVYSHFRAIVRALRDCPVPTIAAKDGPAIGLGLDLALCCDIRLLGVQATVAQGWGRIGLIPGAGGAALLQSRAPGLLWQELSAPSILSAANASHAGIGDVDFERSALDEALRRAGQLATIPRAALQGYARLARRDLPDDTYLDLCARIQGELLTGPDFRVAARMALRPKPRTA